jgi:hypothetical protein
MRLSATRLAGISHSGSAWTPALLGPGLVLWLDAADVDTVILNGSTVSQWSDKSGLGNHLSNATSATQPGYLATAFNSKPTLQFTTAGEQFLHRSSMSDLNSASDFFMAAVFEAFDISRPWDMICGFRATPNSQVAAAGAALLQFMATSQEIGTHNTDLQDVRAKVDITTRVAKRIATVGRNGGTQGNGGTLAVTATNPSQASYLTTSTQTWQSPSTTGFQVGGRQQIATAYGPKNISEIICCAFNPSTDIRQRIEGYLAHNWGMTANLPSDHPFRSAPPTV